MAKSSNSNLREAKKAKNDEFYTQLSDIEAELCHYSKDTFKDKVIYLPTDVNQPHGRVLRSNFIEHFKAKAFDYGYKALVATCLLENNPDDDNKYVIKRHKTSYYPGRQYNLDGKVQNTPETPYYSYEEYFGHCPSDKELGIEDGYGSGDFRSKHAQEIIEEADIVVTNPPFSLFREFIAWLMRNEKKFIVWGGRANMTYKDIFAYIKNKELWLGTMVGNHKKYITPEGGLKEVGTGIFTNVDYPERHEEQILYCKYEGNESKYPRYDNYNAIDVSKAKEIPQDYEGIMGVPITFLYKLNPDQFEILGITNNGEDNSEYLLDGWKETRAVLNGNFLYSRVLIRRKAK